MLCGRIPDKVELFEVPNTAARQLGDCGHEVLIGEGAIVALETSIRWSFTLPEEGRQPRSIFRAERESHRLASYREACLRCGEIDCD